MHRFIPIIMAAATTTTTTCEYCLSGTPHPQFVSLLFDSRLSPDDLMAGPPPATVQWDYSRQPLVNLNCHARKRRFRIGPKSTKQMAPFIQHAMLIGPFYGGASIFVRVMKSKCKRFKQKLVGAVAMARRWHSIDDGRQRGARVRVMIAHIKGHMNMMKQVLMDAEENNDKYSGALEQYARTLVAAAASASASTAAAAD